jgi:hypothetical protein
MRQTARRHPRPTLRPAPGTWGLALAALLAPAAGMAQSVQAAQTPPTPQMTEVAVAEAVLAVTRVDARKCMYPLCGGYFVKAVNAALTRCADGTMAKECHAVELDTRKLGWTPEQQSAFEDALVKGQALVTGALTPQPRGLSTGEVLEVSQGWQGQGRHKPQGTFFGVRSTGIVCVRAPCPSIEAVVLNTLKAPSYPEVNLSASGASKSAIEAAWKAVGTRTGIIAVGYQIPTLTPALDGQGSVKGRLLLATQFYLPAKP